MDNNQQNAFKKLEKWVLVGLSLILLINLAVAYLIEKKLIQSFLQLGWGPYIILFPILIFILMTKLVQTRFWQFGGWILWLIALFLINPKSFSGGILYF